MHYIIVKKKRRKKKSHFYNSQTVFWNTSLFFKANKKCTVSDHPEPHQTGPHCSFISSFHAVPWSLDCQSPQDKLHSSRRHGSVCVGLSWKRAEVRGRPSKESQEHHLWAGVGEQDEPLRLQSSSAGVWLGAGSFGDHTLVLLSTQQALCDAFALLKLG